MFEIGRPVSYLVCEIGYHRGRCISCLNHAPTPHKAVFGVRKNEMSVERNILEKGRLTVMRGRKGSTLTELLMQISVIAPLIAILLLAFRWAERQATAVAVGQTYTSAVFFWAKYTQQLRKRYRRPVFKCAALLRLS
jgi:hypothetical protein